MALAATCLSDDFDAVLALAADVARHPRFADDEIATRRDNLITLDPAGGRRSRRRWPPMRSRKRCTARIPYARKVRGTVAGIEAIRRQDLVRFHQKGFDPSAITVIVVGDVEEDAAIADGRRSCSATGRTAPSRPATSRSRRGARRRPSTTERAAGRRADDEQGAGRRGLRLRRHSPLGSRLHARTR